MLGSLARWLRFAGFDTRYEPDWTDAALAGLTRAEGRWLLTRDRALASVAGPRVVLLKARDLGALVGELRDRLELPVDPARFMTRCAECNGELREVAREAVADRVPPFVATHGEHFRRCVGCGRVYWPGTHAGRIAQRLRELFYLSRGHDDRDR
jgi:uncharacterized protein